MNNKKQRQLISGPGKLPSGPSTSRSALQFDGLTYRRTAGGIESWVLVGPGDEGTRSERFRYAPRTP